MALFVEAQPTSCFPGRATLHLHCEKHSALVPSKNLHWECWNKYIKISDFSQTCFIILRCVHFSIKLQHSFSHSVTDLDVHTCKKVLQHRRPVSKKSQLNFKSCFSRPIRRHRRPRLHPHLHSPLKKTTSKQALDFPLLSSCAQFRFNFSTFT